MTIREDRKNWEELLLRRLKTRHGKIDNKEQGDEGGKFVRFNSKFGIWWNVKIGWFAKVELARKSRGKNKYVRA